MKHRIVSFFILLFVSVSQLWGQTQIRGSVYDRAKRQPLSGVTVELQGTSVRVMTDREGFFVFPPVDSGAHRIIFSRAGYRTERRTLDILKTDPVFSVGVSLRPVGVEAEELKPSSAHGYSRATLSSPFVQLNPNSRNWQKWQSRSMPEALGQQSPSLWLISPRYSTPTVQMRGMDPRRQGWRYEGVLLSPSLSLPGEAPVLGLLDPWSVSQSDILLGSGFTLWGAGNPGGQVLMRSEVPTFSWRKFAAHGNLKHEQLFGGVGRGTHANISIHTPFLGISGGVSSRNWGDLQGADGLTVPGSGYQQKNSNLTLALKLGKRQSLTLGVRQGIQEQTLLLGQYRTGIGQVAQDERSHQLTYATYRLNLDNAFVSTIKATVGLQRYRDELARELPDSLPGQKERLELNSLSGRVEVLSVISPLWHISTGIEMQREAVSSEVTALDPNGTEELLPALLPNGSTYGQMSLFSLHTLDLLKLRLIFGGRIQGDLRSVGSQQNPADWQSLRLAGNVGGMYPLSPNYQVFGNLRAGYRAPSLFELGGFGQIPSGIAVPSDSLRGEQVVTSEIGIKAQTDHFVGVLALYRSQFKDYIGYTSGSWQGADLFLDQYVWQATNVGRAFIQGLEASIEVPVVPAVSVYGSLIYSYGERINQGLPMERIPPLNSRLGVYWQHALGLWSRLEWRYAGSQELLAPIDRRDPAVVAGNSAWNVLDLKLGYEFKWGYATLGILNLLDEQYLYYGSDLPGQGRVVVGSLQLGF